MVKWLNYVTVNRGKSLVPSTIISLVIVLMLIMSGPAQAVAVNIAGLQDLYIKGNDIEFQVKIDINDPDQYVSITNISLDMTGPLNKTIFFALNGKQISGDCKIKVKPVSIPKDDFGYGNSYGYDSGAGYGYDFGYGYGYNYGSGGEKISFIYNVTIDTDKKCFAAGNYSVVASLNTGKNVTFQSPAFGFRLQPAAQGDKIKAKDNKAQKDVEECKCDELVKNDDHEDECDDHVTEDGHEDKKVNDHSPERNKKDDTKNSNNGRRGNNVVINNNIYITDNSGTVTVNINNQGNSKTKENDGNSRSQSNRKFKK